MAQLRIELSVEMDDGRTFGVVTDQRDWARFEVQPFGWPVTRAEEKAGMVLFRFLAWSAATRQGQLDMTWDTFERECVEALPVDDPAEDTDAEDPGRPAPSDTPSSRSRGRRANR